MSGSHDSGEIHAAATDGGAPKQVRSEVKCVKPQVKTFAVIERQITANRSPWLAVRVTGAQIDLHRKSISSIHWPLFLPVERDLHPLLKYKCHLPITRKSDRLHLPPECGKVIHHCPELIARTSKFIKY
jgi:hypothetical protein